MDDVVEVYNVQNLCRLCLSTDEPRSPIFGVQDSAPTLADKIQACLSIKITSTDKLSTVICVSCVKNINQWHTYKSSCLKSQDKLEKWLANQKSSEVCAVKTEPLDPDESIELVNMSDNDSIALRGSEPVKIELDDDSESVVEGELLLNPMALNANKSMEPDSTEKFNLRKKKIRRGPHTHFRGVKVYKQRCSQCQLVLHSKKSYAKHMERYHAMPANGLEEVEDVEEELMSLEKDAPLTKVQESIISQLKTFSCYACQQSFSDRRSTLNHIRQHMPDLRPYTCIACLTEFPDRSIYKLHCGASFECAMKIALVVPKHGTEKYFTCNMCLRPMPNRKELISHLSKHSDRQYEALTAPKSKPNAAGPYREGNPEHNHTCEYCGMIYRYKPNMLKHTELCKRLPPHERTSYRCVHCGMTFLVFKKFQSHLVTEHGRKDFVCYDCGEKFAFSSEFQAHHVTHRGEKLVCAVCSAEFSTRAELTEHRNTHLKMKIFSCTVCRRMFGNSAALAEHAAEHAESADSQSESEEPKWDSRSTECATCGKVFANYPNLRRHIRSVHSERKCPKCSKIFTSEAELSEHERTHEPSERCGYCKKRFETREAMNLHARTFHGATEDSQACDICGKEFGNETSLKIHRGHHFRRDSRLSIRNIPHPMDAVAVEMTEPKRTQATVENGTPPRSDMQCQVCDEQFNNVHDLRKHLWEVHCAKNKPEKSFGDELTCELCTNVFADTAGLEEHMQWHKDNPILEERNVDISCDICGKFYSSLKALWKHKKLHKASNAASAKLSVKKPAPTQFPCPVCRKVFGNETSMKKHKAAAHYVRRTIAGTDVEEEEAAVKPKRPKLDFDVIRKAYNLGQPSSSLNPSSKKPVTCGICKKLLPSMSSLYKHRQNVHKQDLNKSLPNPISEEADDTAGTPCTDCDKVFSSLANMKQHYTKVHGTGGKYYCNTDSCNEVFSSPLAKQLHEKTHMNMLYSCNICSRHVFTRGAMSKHLLTEHKAEYQPSAEKTFYRKTDLNSYVVKNAEGRVCPICKITYPNIKAMKIHYVKIHESS